MVQSCAVISYSVSLSVGNLIQARVLSTPKYYPESAQKTFVKDIALLR